MAADFNRIITLLRKERGITQKQAAEDLGVSQALLSHYEKGIRECGLDFVVRIANYYNVSCDYLLGRSADRSGLTLTVDEIPGPESSKDSHFKGSALPVLNKKLISNSLNILFDKLQACPDKELVSEVSGYLMLAVYKMFRSIYGAYPKNPDDLFSISKGSYAGYAGGAMQMAETRVRALLENGKLPGGKDPAAFAMTTETLAKEYPLYETSLLNLIRVSEERINRLVKPV